MSQNLSSAAVVIGALRVKLQSFQDLQLHSKTFDGLGNQDIIEILPYLHGILAYR